MAKAKTKAIARKNKWATAELLKVLVEVNSDNPSQKAKDQLAKAVADGYLISAANHLGQQSFESVIRNLPVSSYLVRKSTKDRAKEISKELGYGTSTLILEKRRMMNLRHFRKKCVI